MNAVTSLSQIGAPERPAAARVAGSREAKAWNQAQEFESVFLNTMFGQMFSTLGGESPLGSKKSEAWRGFLVEEYSKSVAAKGGVGLAPAIYRELIGADGRAPVSPRLDRSA